jgi:hypothetical protein
MTYKIILEEIIDFVMFEPVDSITLKTIESLFKKQCPGNFYLKFDYHKENWINTVDDIEIVFQNKQDELIWKLKWV